MASPEDLFGKIYASTSDPIRVMLVDDSKVVLAVFARILNTHQQIDIVHQATDVSDALEFLHNEKVDVILLDIEMPGRTGLEALPEILTASKGAKVMIVSSFVEREGPAAIAALEMGACDTLSKPGKTGYRGQFSELLRDRVFRLGRSDRDKEISSTSGHKSHDVEAIETPECIAIGSSTGGLPAIYTLVGNLTVSIECPIFITQHLPDAFVTFFAKQLGSVTKRTVKVPCCGESVMKNTIYIAPGDSNLGLATVAGKLVIKLKPKRPENIYCPSVDVMFENIAEHYGHTALAVIFSGMGNDGVKGAQELFVKNATIVAQDSASSVVWGMPGSIARMGLASLVLDPEQLVLALNKGASK
jgi:two-component system, chemotaxis family, protein-glutamate methylesterase/glutaminase